MPRTDYGWEITPDELRAWTLYQDGGVLALNKPAHVVCHPSKRGPWSSLAGACREYLGASKIHMPVRLDRETSGVVVIVSDEQTGRRFHSAVTHRRVSKTYLAVLHGELHQALVVDAPLGPDPEAEYSTRQTVLDEGGREAVTEFEPLSHGRGVTLVRVRPRTGRMHQIRAHALHVGFPIVGDKLYGTDPRYMFEFMRSGFSDELRAALLIDRQCLHAAELVFHCEGGDWTFQAPTPRDFTEFCISHDVRPANFPVEI